MKERLIVQQLRDFIDNEQYYPIALVAGIRRVGKTTVLKQLQDYYPDAVYIDLSDMKNNQEVIEDLFLDNPTSLLLLDEITYLDDYERVSQFIFNETSGNHGRRFKVVMTGSSPAHLTKLKGTKLGGRCKLFRLPPMTFIEYLYMTNRIPDYQHYHDISNDDFADYLLLSNLNNELGIQFDNDYFNAFYYENTIGNQKSHLSHSITHLEQDDLKNMTNLVAYKLSEASSYSATINPPVGWLEHDSLYNLGIKVKMSKIDLSDAFISNSKDEALGISAVDKGRILSFLLYAGLANIEYGRVGPSSKKPDVGDILYNLQHCTEERDLKAMFEEISICLTTPLFYTRIGGDILSRMKVNIRELCRGMLLGKMLEVYIRGALSMYSSDSIMVSTKLKYPDVGEVDIYNQDLSIICESSCGDKDTKNIHVHEYLKNEELIRVCSSRTKDYFNGKFYQIPYARLCCMIDTGDILKLNKTTINDENSTGLSSQMVN